MWKVCDELLEPYNVGRKYFPIFCQCQIMKWAGINYEGADTPRSNQKKHPRSKCFEVMNSSSMQRNRPLGWKSLFLIKFNVRHFFCISWETESNFQTLGSALNEVTRLGPSLKWVLWHYSSPAIPKPQRIIGRWPKKLVWIELKNWIKGKKRRYCLGTKT